MQHDVTAVLSEAWRVLLLVAVPFFLVPLAGAVASLILGVIGVRDEGLSYAVRVAAMVVVVAIFIPAVVGDVVELMGKALR